MLAFRSFRTRLIAFFVGLLFLALATTFLAVNRANIDNANRVITADLAEDAAVGAMPALQHLPTVPRNGQNPDSPVWTWRSNSASGSR